MKLNLKKIAMVGVLAASTTSAFATELKLANFMSPNHPYEAGVFQPFADQVSQATGGEVTVKVFSGGELGAGPVDQYNRVVDGVADMAFGLPGYTASLFPKTLLSELPGLINDETGTQELLDNIELFNDEFRRVRLVGLWSNSANALYTATKPVRTLDDLKGLKIRVPSRNAGLVVESWGATPVSMPVPEIYNAMQTGVIDGAFIDGTATFAFRLSEVTNYITTGMDSSTSSFFIIANRDSFNDLSDEQQQAVLDAGMQASVAANRIQLGGSAKGLKDFSEAEGKELIVLSADEAERFNAASAKVVEAALKDADAASAEVIKALLKN